MNSLDQILVNKYILKKQHLTENSKINDIIQIIDDICGLHATATITPYLSLFARNNNFKKADLENELYKSKNLGRFRCMRKTIFIQSKHMIPIIFAATNNLFRNLWPKYMEYHKITKELYEKTSRQILDSLKGKELPISEINKIINIETKLSPFITLMCDQGLLIRGKPLKSWKDRRNNYAVFNEYFPDISLTKINEEEALAQLVQKYMKSYSPITEKDILWWTGQTLTKIRKALNDNEKSIEKVKISGLKNVYMMFESELTDVYNLVHSKKPTLNLLPHLDPYIMGYKERERYIDPIHYSMVFDRSGNATSTILLDGKVIGVWDVAERPNLSVKLFLFKDLENKLRGELFLKAYEIGKFYFDDPVEIEECNSMVPLTERPAGNFATPLKKS